MRYQLATDARPQARTLLFAALLTIALWFIPYANIVTYPFRLFVTFIHEGGHAIASLLTGNAVRSLTVAPNASGLTETYMTNAGLFTQTVISSAGYIGAMLFGALLLVLVRRTVAAVRAHRTPKGDPLETARLAGIMAAKRTSDLIPLCHPLPLTHADVRAELRADGVHLEAEVATNAQTGVEMEALTAVSIAALTVYDMCKAIDKAMTITDVRLERKTGGKSGDYERMKDEG